MHSSPRELGPGRQGRRKETRWLQTTKWRRRRIASAGRTETRQMRISGARVPSPFLFEYYSSAIAKALRAVTLLARHASKEASGSDGGTAWPHEADWPAYLLENLRLPAQSGRHGRQGCPGIAPAFEHIDHEESVCQGFQRGCTTSSEQRHRKSKEYPCRTAMPKTRKKHLQVNVR